MSVLFKLCVFSVGAETLDKQVFKFALFFASLVFCYLLMSAANSVVLTSLNIQLKCKS